MSNREILFLNVYSVARHRGGPEEGGWYYNSGIPLASVPIWAKRVQGHQSCSNCWHALNGSPSPHILRVAGAVPGLAPGYELCREDPTEQAINEWIADRRQQAYEVYAERDPGHYNQLMARNAEEWQDTPEYDAWLMTFPLVSHLVPENEIETRTRIEELKEMFAGEAHGDIYSVRGGEAIEVQLEDRMAEPWPKERPRYE